MQRRPISAPVRTEKFINIGRVKRTKGIPKKNMNGVNTQ